jgi:hypothetical protein
MGGKQMVQGACLTPPPNRSDCGNVSSLLSLLPRLLPGPCLPGALQFGKWVTDNATIGGKFVSASLDERNEFLTVRPIARGGGEHASSIACLILESDEAMAAGCVAAILDSIRQLPTLSPPLPCPAGGVC